MTPKDLAARVRARLRRHVLDALDERGLVEGMRIEIARPRQCRIHRFEEAAPGPGEVLVETLLSVVSPGTERAIYLALENVLVEYPYVLGYSQVGRVVAAGGQAELQPGEVVVSQGPHASLALISAARAVRAPEGVSPDAAAMTPIGIIALQGVRKARIEPGERVAVLGCGLIGQLAAQLARTGGGTVTAVARSPERLAVARACGIADTLDLREERERLTALAVDVVIEATGNPQGVLDATRAARPGGRVVLLGSSRGVTRGIDLTEWQRRGVTLVGAHTANLPQADPSPAAWTWRREAETFLGLLAQGRLQAAPLVSRRVSPGDAASVYADLARPEDKSVAVLFDWSAPGPWRLRIEKASPLRGLLSGAKRALGNTAAAPALFAAARPDGRRLRFGLIGCGEIAAENAAALRAVQTTTVSFAVDPNGALARGLAAATSARYGDRVEELLASPEVDAVLISTPHHLHAPLAIQAAEAGKHVVVEKPMATTVADCDRMMEAARQNGVILSVCYCQRFDPRVQRARRLLEAGAIGEILGTRISFGQPRSEEYWTQGLTGRTESDWRGRREAAGGGVLIMNACHILDYMGWLVGRPVSDVTAFMATLRHAVDVEDTITMSYRYAGGALGTLDATTAVAGPGIYEQAIWGRDGQLVVAPVLRFWSRKTVDGGYEAGRWHSVRSLPRSAERRQFFEAFASAVLDGKPPPVTADEARAVQAFIEAAYRSAEARVSVGLAEGGA